MWYLHNSVTKFHFHYASSLRPVHWSKQTNNNALFYSICRKLNNDNLQVKQTFAVLKLSLITLSKENTEKYLLHIILTNSSLYPSEINDEIYKAADIKFSM